jgi:O-antigen ligase
LVRILSFSAESADASEEALESSEMRRHLLQESILYTLQHPLFGVGMEQFSNYEGIHSTLVGGLRGFWHETHNTYTQVSSECGIPALALYLAGIVSTFLMLNRVYRRACGKPDCADIRNAAFCIMLAMTAYCTATTFLNFAYFFYLPAIASLAIAVSNAAQVEFDRRSSQEPQPGFMPPYRRPLPRVAVTPIAK